MVVGGGGSVCLFVFCFEWTSLFIVMSVRCRFCFCTGYEFKKRNSSLRKNVKQACLRPGSRHVTSVCHGVLTDGEADVCFSVKYRRGPIEPRLRNFGQVKCAVLGCG